MAGEWQCAAPAIVARFMFGWNPGGAVKTRARTAKVKVKPGEPPVSLRAGTSAFSVLAVSAAGRSAAMNRFCQPFQEQNAASSPCYIPTAL